MNFSKFYSEHAGKNVRIETTDGETFTGKLFAFFSAADNDPEPEAVVIEDIEFPTTEIKSIQLT